MPHRRTEIDPRVHDVALTDEELEELEEAAEEDTEETTEETSLDELVGEAEPRNFDRTFLVEKSDVPLAVEEAIPIPQPWEGIPRAAIVFNFNYVWDDEEQRWIRDQGNGGLPSWTDFDLREIDRSTDTSDIAAGVGELHAVTNTTGSTIDVNLPDGPSDGDHVAVYLLSGSNNIDIQPGTGDTIMSLSGNWTLNGADAQVFEYVDALDDWITQVLL